METSTLSFAVEELNFESLYIYNQYISNQKHDLKGSRNMIRRELEIWLEEEGMKS